ncbi:MAG: hypothetical protein ACK5NK_08910 [Niabella sp.]
MLKILDLFYGLSAKEYDLAPVPAVTGYGTACCGTAPTHQAAYRLGNTWQHLHYFTMHLPKANNCFAM